MDRREFLLSTSSGLVAAGWSAASGAANEPARYIWYDSEGLGRNLYGLFRRDVYKRQPIYLPLNIGGLLPEP